MYPHATPLDRQINYCSEATHQHLERALDLFTDQTDPPSPSPPKSKGLIPTIHRVTCT